MYKEGTDEVLARKTAEAEVTKWDAQKSGNTTTFKTRMEGTNPLFPGADPVVWTNTVTITNNVSSGYIDVKLTIFGKGFPALESFIEDSKGTRVFIGIYDAPGKVSAIPSLTGSELSYSHTSFVRIYTNSDGSFSGTIRATIVTPQGTQQITLPIDMWNIGCQITKATSDL